MFREELRSAAPAQDPSNAQNKTSQTHRVMGRSSNSPPPKSAHKQTTVFEKSWEWPECATWGSPGWIADSPDPQASRWKIFGIFVEVFFTW